MKIKTILTATAGLLALAACNNEQEWESTYQSDPNAVIVTATLQGAGTVDNRSAAGNTAGNAAGSTNTVGNTVGSTSTIGSAAGANTRANTESTGDAFVIGTDRFRVTNTTANTAGTNTGTNTVTNTGTNPGTNAANPANPTNTAHYTYTAPATWTLTDAAGTPVTSPYLTWAEGDNTFEAYMPVGETTTTYATFTLPATQTDVASLRAADWMTATATKARTDADRTVDLRFTHRLAKVKVSITGYRNEFGTTPPLLENVQFKLPTLDLAAGVTLPATGAIAPLVSPDASPAALHSYTAILAPGKYAAGADFLTMTIAGQTVTVKVNDLLATTGLTPGKSYTFDLTVGNHIATLTSFTVGDWVQGEDISLDNSFGIRLASTDADGVNTYDIANAAGLKAFADIVNGTDNGQPRTIYGITIPATPTDQARKSHARLMEDIDLKGLCSATSGKSWTPIGKTLDKPYQGTFEGNHHTLNGLYIDHTQSAAHLTADAQLYQGLFGTLSNATVQNLVVEGSILIDVTATTGTGGLYIYAGGIAGLTGHPEVAGIGSTLANCHSAVSVTATFGDNTTAGSRIYAGGIAGYAYAGSLNDCTSTGVVSVTVTASSPASTVIAGGICGLSQAATLVGCRHLTGDVSGNAQNGATYTGGVVGLAYNSNTGVQLLGCTNGAAVSGNGSGLYIGGVAGMSHAPVVACRNSGTISYSAGNFLYAGGVVGGSENIVVASISTEIPKGGGNTPGTNIGGIIGAITLSDSPASTCFYAADADCGTDGIGYNTYSSSSPVVNCGRIATPAALNDKVGEMNAAIDDYNAGTITGTGITITPPATKYPYRWKQSAAGAPELDK